MYNYLTWNGIRSDSLGLTVERYPNMNRPSRKYTVADVPGRNGAAYIMQDAWGEVIQNYEISAKNPVQSFKSVAEWLNSSDGYAILTDSYDPTIYRMAVCVNAFDVETALNRAGRALVQFNCRPERFMITSNIEVATPVSASISNPTAHVAHPLIRIDGQGFPSLLQTTGRTKIQVGDPGEMVDCYPGGVPIKGLTEGAHNLYWGIHAAIHPTKGQYVYVFDDDAITSITGSEGDFSMSQSGGTTSQGIGFNVEVQPNTTYNCSFVYGTTNTYSGALYPIFADREGRFISYTNSLNTQTFQPSNTRRSVTFTTPANAYWCILSFDVGTNGTSGKVDDIQLNLGDTALPYLSALSDTSASFIFGDCEIHLAGLYDYMYIDCESMNAYREPGENLNPLVSVMDLYGAPSVKFPRLEKGATTVSRTGTDWITKLTITPRYWTL